MTITERKTNCGKPYRCQYIMPHRRDHTSFMKTHGIHSTKNRRWKVKNKSRGCVAICEKKWAHDFKVVYHNGTLLRIGHSMWQR